MRLAKTSIIVKNELTFVENVFLNSGNSLFPENRYDFTENILSIINKQLVAMWWVK